MALGCCLHNISFSVNSLVGNDAAPVERFDDIFLCSRNKTLGIGVFNPYDKVASALFREEVVI